jgi:SAM-dependent methyltransferase
VKRAGLSRQYVKLCDVRDFDDPTLRAMLRDIVPGHEPEAELRRKFWEYAMLGLYLDEVGALKEETEVLAVAAGHEEPLFWLANRVRRVVATDIYGEGGFAYREADDSMLTNPRAFAPYDYREDRLEVRSMNALDLDLPSESFDVVYSLSSIEHFGSPADIRRGAAEMARVVRPGGHLVIVTECLVGSHLLDIPLVQFGVRIATLGRRARMARPNKRIIDAFTPSELERDVVQPTGMQLVQPLHTGISPETWDNLIRWVGAGELHPRTGRPYPHVLLQAHGSPWTSAFLALHKPA